MTLAVFRCYVAPEQRAEHDRLYNQMHILIQQSLNHIEHKMFTAEDLKLAYVIITAILTAGVSMRVLARLGMKGRGGAPINVSKKPLQMKKNIIGGTIFGLGWAISGACPGTVLAQAGEGKLLGLVTMFGMILGTFLYAVMAERQKE